MSRSRRATVLVTDAGRGSGLAFVRSLARAGYTVVAVDADTASLAFRSRCAHHCHQVPSALRDPTGFVDALDHITRKHAVDLLIPITDEAIHPLVHHRQRLGDSCALAVGPPQAMAITTDKEATLALAKRTQVETPTTVCVQAADVGAATRAAEPLGYPIVLKPAVSRRYLPEQELVIPQSVTYAADATQLAAALSRYEPDSTLLLQEYVAGEGHGIGVLAREGEVRLAFQHRRLAEVPVTGGASAWRESVALDAGLMAATTRLVDALRWSGLLMVEFKLGDRALLMEINGRTWGSLPLALRAGVDFPAALAAQMLENAPPLPEDQPAGQLGGYRTGVKTFNLELAWPWLAQVLRGRRRHRELPGPARRDAWPLVRGLLDLRQGSDVIDWKDPLPGLYQVPRIARKLVRKARTAQREVHT